jgi:hypothetical protein
VLSIPAYPRRNWSFRLGIATVMLSLGLTLGYGIPVSIRIVEVSNAEQAGQDAANANHFWRMVAGIDPIDHSDLGRVAATTRRIGERSHPIRELMHYYVAPGELPDVDDQLGYHAFDRPSSDGRGTDSGEGHFTDRFILNAIQAVGAVDGASVKDLMQPIPDVPDYGVLRWEWGAGALAGLLSLCGLAALWLRRDRRRWPARAEARAVAKLPDEQRQVYRLVKALELEPADKQRDKLLEQAKALFADMGQGLDTRDKLADMREALAEAAETWEVKRKVYQELTDWNAPDRKEQG